VISFILIYDLIYGYAWYEALALPKWECNIYVAPEQCLLYTRRTHGHLFIDVYVPLFNETIRKRNHSQVMRWGTYRNLQDHMILIDADFI
jgi:hypothetical protein